jgi:hypothetical protein
LEMTPAFEQTQLPLFLHPARRTPRWTAGIREAHAAHAPIPITYGRGGFFGRESGDRALTLPGLHNECEWPPHRIALAAGVRGPEAGWDSGHQAVPCSPRQRGLGRGRALLLRLLLGVPPAVMDDRCWASRHQEPRGHPRGCPHAKRPLQALPLDGGQPRRQGNRVPPTGSHGHERRLRRAPTETIGASRGKARERFERQRAPSKDNQPAGLGSCDHGIASALVGNVPWRQRHMTQETGLIVPPRLHVGPRLGRPPAGAGNSLGQGFGQANAGAVRAISMRQGGQQSLRTPGFEGLDFGQGLPQHGRKTGQGLLVPPLVHGFRRTVHLLAPWRERRRSWCPCRVGRTPRAKRHAGAEALAGTLRRPLDTAGATCRGFNLVGRKARCEPGYRPACTGRHGSLLGRVLGRVRQPSLTPQGDCSLS